MQSWPGHDECAMFCWASCASCAASRVVQTRSCPQAMANLARVHRESIQLVELVQFIQPGLGCQHKIRIAHNCAHHRTFMRNTSNCIQCTIYDDGNTDGYRDSLQQEKTNGNIGNGIVEMIPFKHNLLIFFYCLRKTLCTDHS